MEAKPTLLRIPLLALHEVISYLNTKEVYSIFVKVCREFHKITKSSKEIPINLIIRAVGRSDETIGILKGFKLPALLDLLKSMHSVAFELPYHGIRTDGGCDGYKAQYFMDRVFQAHSGYTWSDAFSSDSADEVHVEGALALDYFDSKQLLKYLAVDDGVNDKLLERYKQYETKEKSDIQAVLAKASLANENNLEISHFPLEETNSVITSIEVRRPHFFTCIAKTIALFSSDERIDFSDPLLKAFSGMKTQSELAALYESSAAKLPQIEATNILSLKKYARQKAYDPIVEPADSTEVVLFSNKTKSKVKIVAWMRIVPATLKEVKVNLKRNNYFSGKYVVGKLIDRDLTDAAEDDERPPNYDLKSISLKGILLTENNVLMATLKNSTETSSDWKKYQQQAPFGFFFRPGGI